MDKKVYITIDSPSDVNEELRNKFDIAEVIPLHIVLGDKAYDDGRTINVDEMLAYYDETGRLPKTSAVSVDEYANIFKKYQDAGCEVVHISLSSKISSTHYNAVLASREFENIYVVDSEALSLSMALLALKACDMRAKGMSGREIHDELNRCKSKIKTAFIIDSLEFLYKGGRCSGLAALGANVLKIKPCIVMEDGVLSPGKKYRGKLESCQMQYLKDRFEASGGKLDKSRIFVGYTSGMSGEQLAAIQKEVKKGGFKEIFTFQVGCTITAHCGRNTFAVFLAEN